MDQKILKQIKKYARLRGKDQEGITAETLEKAFLQASPDQQFRYLQEMEDYFAAIASQKVIPGQSILHTIYERTATVHNGNG